MHFDDLMPIAVDGLLLSHEGARGAIQLISGMPSSADKFSTRV